MSILHKKLSLPLIAILMLWTSMLIVAVGIFFLVVISIGDKVTGVIPKPDPIFNVIKHFHQVAAGILLVLWRVSTFHRWDLVWLMRREGVHIKSRNRIFTILQSWFWSFPQGTFDQSFIMAHVYGAFNLPVTFPEGMHLTAENVYSRDKIEFISVINCPFDINEEIKINRSMKIIQMTGVAGIDSIIEEALHKEQDFHARLVFNENYFRMTISSSPWLGGRYEDKVVKGFEVFRRIDKTLRSNYPHKRIVDIETKWNGHKDQFEILRITAVEGI